MAHNREWDKGKEFWHDTSPWSTADSKANVRIREDHYQGDGKRRKFNNGTYVYDASQSFGDSGTDGSQGHMRHGDHQDHGHDDRSRAQGTGGFKKRLTPSEPSPHVIFLGLDPDFTEADLQAYLSSYGCSIETVTIIRDRSTEGTSKGFGFAQFTSTELAKAFVDPLFPFVQVPPPASHGASATATFYKALETGVPHNGRRVKIDYSQSATPHDRGRSNRGNVNDGTRDIGNTQSPILLLRGLDPLSGPQAIYQAMLYSSGSGPGKQGPRGMRRIILIKDKVTMASYGFAFVEFVDVQSASQVLAATMSPQLHPNGFRISDKPVAASFAHPHSFQPVTDFIQRDEACLKSTNSLGGADGMWVRYWDESSTCAVLEFKVEVPVAATPVQKEKKDKKKKAEIDARTKQGLAAPSALPVSDKPVTLSLSKGVKASSVRPLAPGISMDDETGAAEVTEEEENDIESNKSVTLKKAVPPVASKKTVDNIQKWNQVQVELAKGLETSTQTSAPSAREDTGIPASETEFEFADVNALMCLLCARQFKSVDQLKRHNKESDLHKRNGQDANLRDVARRKADARRAAVVANQPKYRDRASERRVLFNQPETPAPEQDNSRPSNKRRQSEGPLPPSPPPELGKDENNVGNKLLKLMGWKEGQGLGTEGEGRVEPIQTAVYAQGVGLGASKAKEIGRYAEGYSGYVHMAQDAARERYGNQDRT